MGPAVVAEGKNPSDWLGASGGNVRCAFNRDAGDPVSTQEQLRASNAIMVSRLRGDWGGTSTRTSMGGYLLCALGLPVILQVPHNQPL